MDRSFERQTKRQRTERLSAYLDGQLSVDDRARLEAQLANDPTLRSELETLQHTVTLLHDLPPVPIPRNFVLPRTAVAHTGRLPAARRTRPWSAPLLTAATAAVSVLFGLVLVVELMLGGTGQQTLSLTAVKETAPQVAMEPSPAVERAEAEKALPNEEARSTPPPMGEAATEDAEGLAEVVDATPAALPPGALEAPPAAAVEEAPREDLPAEAPAFEVADGSGTGAAPTPTAASLPPTAEEADVGVEKEEGERASPESTSPPSSWDAADAAPEKDEAAQPVEEAAEEQVESTDGQRVHEGQTAARTALLPWHVLEIALGITAVALAAATVLAWRARRH